MIKEYLIKKVLDASIEVAKKTLKESDSKLDNSISDLEESVNYHLRSIKNWADEISFNDLKKPRLTSDVFVHLDLLVYPKRLRFSRKEDIQSIPLKHIFNQNNRHVILLGQPGAGKTTSMKFLCRSLLYDPQFCEERFSFPILIKFRDLNGLRKPRDLSIIFDQIFNTLGLRLIFPESLLKDKESNLTQRQSIKQKLVISILDELKVLLILDGFDELAKLTDRESALGDVTHFALHLERAGLLITSRTGDFAYNIEHTVQYEIAPLTEKQIAIFARKWLKSRLAAKRFVSDIQKSTFWDTAVRPLTLAHLCAIYERIGTIPDKPKTVYRKIVNLLLEEWDQQRSVKRLSKYAKFEIDRKFEFLCHLAYQLTTSLQTTVFSTQDLIDAYKEIYKDFDLLSNESKQVVNELETHTGLFLQAGYEEFEFAHKSLQEYLTAEYLVKLPSIPSAKELYKLPNELAIAITISSKPSEYFSELVFNRLMNKGVPKDFSEPFLTRLILEKPDFNTNINLGLSLATLFSLHIESMAYTTNELKFVHEGVVVQMFDKLISQVFNRTSVDIIKACYVKVSTHTINNNLNIHRLKKREGQVPKVVPNLPPFLYVSDVLYKVFSGQNELSKVE